jgi:hypothetical protein
MVAVYIATSCFVRTYAISYRLYNLFLTLIEKRFLHVITAWPVVLSSSHAVRIKDSLILREVSLCCISTATIAVSACTSTQLLLKGTDLKTALFLVLSYKWMKSSTIVNIELVYVNPSGCCLLTITYLRLNVKSIYVERTTA